MILCLSVASLPFSPCCLRSDPLLFPNVRIFLPRFYISLHISPHGLRDFHALVLMLPYTCFRIITGSSIREPIFNSHNSVITTSVFMLISIYVMYMFLYLPCDISFCSYMLMLSSSPVYIGTLSKSSIAK